jgi:hypothetical protein
MDIADCGKSHQCIPVHNLLPSGNLQEIEKFFGQPLLAGCLAIWGLFKFFS